MVVKFGIGFGYRNFLLVLFDWYYPHLYNYYFIHNLYIHDLVL